MTPLDLKALCEQTGVSPRTVYFYIQQGLLPPAEGAGRGARYTEVHRDRLRLIRQLQDQHLPLAEIRKQIDSLSDRELSRLADRSARGVKATPARTSAADYISAVLSGARAHTPDSSVPAFMARMASPGTSPPARTVASERSQWDRIVLAPEIELHVRRPLSRVMNRKLEKLLELAQDVMKEQA